VGVFADAGLRCGLTQWKAKPLMCSPIIAKFQMIYNRMMEAQSWSRPGEGRRGKATRSKLFGLSHKERQA
jgi:hypothetical protein